MKDSILTWAIGPDGSPVHVDQVPNGISCNCTCPCCSERLLAKNGGNIYIHHFAHVSEIQCSGAVESALHMLAKHILQREKRIMLPGWQGVTGPFLQQFDTVELEQRTDRSDLQPDLAGVTSDSKRILVEVRCTHAVDWRKRHKLLESGLACVEVDVSGQPLDERRLTRFLTRSTELRLWVSHPEFGRLEQEFRDGVERRRRERCAVTEVPDTQDVKCRNCRNNTRYAEWLRFMDSFTRLPSWTVLFRTMSPYEVAALNLRPPRVLIGGQTYHVDPADMILTAFIRELAALAEKMVQLNTLLGCSRCTGHQPFHE